ncbi:uncharacterized protein LOC111938639 isoform X1 [Cyanistes caeruleus]|uniref:Uncharacterized LOC111938639 n=1 Tax=Cyanistes caeruleus TaxID=156563 RepID=A0A8C0V7W3_CYACU|nr:uncharacterized protein LOC111938639 isoform X1 [Cyanistes caeruleus]
MDGSGAAAPAGPNLPNLTPRHRQLIPTPCGPIKPCSELSFPVKIYFCVTILSLLSVIGLTIETLVRQTEEDFTISFIQLVGVVFCVYYVSRGILQENRQELVVFVLSILLVMLRSIINFTVLPAEQKPKLLARFVLILLVGSFDVICALILIQSQSMMAFRVGGALESLQSQYFMLNLCFSMLTFDLQAQLCLCILLISLHEITLLHNIISATGIVWACLKVTMGIIAILKELKPLVWVFLIQNVPEVVNLIYLLYTCFLPMEGLSPEPSPCSPCSSQSEATLGTPDQGPAARVAIKDHFPRMEKVQEDVTRSLEQCRWYRA